VADETQQNFRLLDRVLTQMDETVRETCTATKDVAAATKEAAAGVTSLVAEVREDRIARAKRYDFLREEVQKDVRALEGRLQSLEQSRDEAGRLKDEAFHAGLDHIKQGLVEVRSAHAEDAKISTVRKDSLVFDSGKWILVAVLGIGIGILSTLATRCIPAGPAPAQTSQPSTP
jgi:hypothetical protein